MSTNIDLDQDHDDIIYPLVLTFLLVHAGCVTAIWSGVSWPAIAGSFVASTMRLIWQKCQILRRIPS